MAALDPTHDHKMINLEIPAKQLDTLHTNLWICETLLTMRDKVQRANSLLHKNIKDNESNDVIGILETLIHDSLSILGDACQGIKGDTPEAE